MKTVVTEFLVLDADKFDGNKLEEYLMSNYKKFPLKVFILENSKELDLGEPLKSKVVKINKKDFEKYKDNEDRLKIFLYRKWFEFLIEKHLKGNINQRNIVLYVNYLEQEGSTNVKNSILENFLRIVFIKNFLQEEDSVSKLNEILEKYFEQENIKDTNILLKRLIHLSRYGLLKEDLAKEIDMAAENIETSIEKEASKYKYNESLIKNTIRDLTGFEDTHYNPLDLFKCSERPETGEEKVKIENNSLLEDFNIKVIINQKNLDSLKENLKDNAVFISYIRHSEKRLSLKNEKVFYIFHENLSGNMEHYYITQSTQIEDILYLIENGLVNIAVCDERIVDSSFVEDEGYLETLENENVYLINNFLGVHIRNENNQKVFISIQKEDDLKKLKEKNIFILIIHLGVLDKLRKDRQGLNEIIDKLLKNVPHIFITSGRGEEIGNILDETKVKFINYSIVGKFLVSKNPSKLSLIRQLMMGEVDDSLCNIGQK